jgi:heme/copper-type cytochrome/quinol oxidase subunit 1
MRLTDRLSQPQRIEIVIALGMAFGAAGTYLVDLGNVSGFGWYAYTPLSQQVYAPRTGLDGWLRLIIWLAMIGLWALVSVRMLRPSPTETDEVKQ